MEPGAPTQLTVRRGVALSGGGSRGDFEVGAMLYLATELFARTPPHIIGGTSVGSVNGAMLAEGDLDSTQRLARTWLGTELYRPVDVLAAFADVFATLTSAGAGVATALTLLGPLGWALVGGIAASAVEDLDDKVFAAINNIHELYSLSPIREQAQAHENGWSATGPGIRQGGCAVAELDGQLVVVARAIDRVLYARTVGGGDRRWRSLGILATSDPVIVQPPQGAPHLVVRDGTNALYAGMLYLTNGVAAVSDLVEPPHPIGDRQRAIDAPWLAGAAAAWDPHLDGVAVAALTEPGLLWQIGRQERYHRWNDAWTTHTGLQSAIGTDVFGGALALAFAANGPGVLVLRRPDGTLVAGTRAAGSAPIPAPFAPVPGPRATSQPTLLAADKTVHLFYRAADNQGMHLVGRTVNGVFQWSAPQPLGGVITSELAAARIPDGRIVAFARGTDGAIWHTVSDVNGTFTNVGWGSLDAGGSGGFVAPPVVRTARDGTLHLFAVGRDRALWHRTRTPVAWGAWTSLGGRVFSGPQLRMAMVSLETGDTRHMDEAGVMRGVPYFAPPMPRTDGIIASSSIPVINKPVRILQETYIDGGLASAIPTLLPECDEVLAITTGPSTMETPDDTVSKHYPDIVAALGNALMVMPGTHETIGQATISSALGQRGAAPRVIDFATANILDVGLRSMTEIFPRSIVELEVAPPGGWSKPVTLIRPTMVIHSSSKIEWTQLSMDYGFMRAYDTVDALDRARATASTDKLVVARLWCGKVEQVLADDVYRYTTQREGTPTPSDPNRFSGGPPVRFFGTNVVSQIAAVRALKAIIARTVEERRAAGDVLPHGAERWSTEWEIHDPRLLAIAATPFASFTLTNPDSRIPPVPVAAG